MYIISRDYINEPNKDFKSPIFTVFLLGIDRVPVEVLLDSGASHAIFPQTTAFNAGLDITKGIDTTVTWGGSATIGKKIRCYIEIESKKIDMEIIFVERLILPYGLLGRIPFFSKFNEVTFLEKTKPSKFELKG